MTPEHYLAKKGYELREVLSEFTNCLVYRVIDDNNDLVIKMCGTPEAYSQVQREGRALKLFQGLEGIPELHEMQTGEKLTNRDGGQLFHTAYVVKEYIKGDIPGHCSSEINKDVAINTLKNIHTNGYAVTDIGHNNIIVDNDGTPHFIDLGQAIKKEELANPEMFETAKKRNHKDLELALNYSPKGHGNILSTHFY